MTKELKNGKKVLVPPRIDDLYRQETSGVKHKIYAFKKSSYNKQMENSFINDMYTRIRNGYGSIENEKLDRIVYKSKIVA